MQIPEIHLFIAKRRIGAGHEDSPLVGVILGKGAGSDLSGWREYRVNVAAGGVDRIHAQWRSLDAFVVSKNRLGALLQNDGVMCFDDFDLWSGQHQRGANEQN